MVNHSSEQPNEHCENTLVTLFCYSIKTSNSLFDFSPFNSMYQYIYNIGQGISSFFTF